MKEDLFRPLKLGSFNVTGKEGLPFWTITHYFEKTILNHMKLTTIQRICELSSKGVPDEYFYLATKSANVYQEKSLDYTLFKDYIVLTTKSGSPKDFWDSILSLKRPVVFYYNGSEGIPLYDFTYEEALRITYFREQSPFNLNFEGSIEALIDLFYAKEREERNRNQHQSEYIGQASRNIEDIARASQSIQNPRTPDGVRNYAEQQLNALMRAQNKLNEKVGIHEINIDERG